MADEFILTQAGLEELKAELRELRTTGRTDIAEKIKEAKSFGDLSENSEYDEAKSDQGKLEARIAEIEYMLQHDTLSTETVHVGSKVVIRDEEFKENLEYRIVGFPQADPMKNKISDESPVGKALLGHKIGDTVEAETPTGFVKFKILEISK